jgi:hypothetical protein
MRARPLILLLLSFSSIAFGQSGCTVEEEQKLSSVTGRFLFQGARVTLTLPNALFSSDLAVVYMQVLGGDVLKGTRLDSGAEVVEIKDGAALHLFARKSNRFVFAKRQTFSVIDAGGQRLCEWATKVSTSRFDSPVIVEGFDPATVTRKTRLLTWQRFFNAGDPILLRVGGKLASEDAEFLIDGRSTTVLARNACQLILYLQNNEWKRDRKSSRFGSFQHAPDPQCLRWTSSAARNLICLPSRSGSWAYLVSIPDAYNSYVVRPANR